MASYLLMRSNGSNTRIEVDDDEFCQDHRKDPPLFHKTKRDGKVYALRCPTSLSQDERRRLFPMSVPMDQAVARIKSEDALDGRRKVSGTRDDLSCLLLALGVSILGRLG
jgi:hypothetical protein